MVEVVIVDALRNWPWEGPSHGCADDLAALVVKAIVARNKAGRTLDRWGLPGLRQSGRRR